MNPNRPDPNAPEPLTADERAWAERLARIGPNGGPPPALDASILAAAHAAASTRYQKQHTTRWPALLGLAATLALAVGVAWQLRPLATAPGVQDEVPNAASAASTAPPPERADEAQASTTASTEAGVVAAESTPAPAGDVGTVATPRLPAPTIAPAPPRTRDSGVTLPIPPQAVATPSPAPVPTATDATPEAMAFPAPAPPAPPPPATPVAKATAAMQQDAAARQRLDRSAAMPQQSAAAESMAADATAENNAAAPATATKGMPEVAEDRYLSPSDWLQRIRLRRDLGDMAAARDSLALFRQIHPGITVPADLRAFAADSAPADE